MVELSPGRVVGGKYRLEQLLGRGGMGTVWIAHHLQLDAPVAVKFMDGAFAASEGPRRRFEREAKAAAQLRSPHVVQVHDHGVEGELPFIVMELLEGEDLGARLKRDRRLSAVELAPIVAQVGKALQRAHDAGIVHRDLKPSNLFLARDGDDEIVKVLDFGVAKMTLAGDGEETASGALLGSAHYMSPEQARGDKSVDHRSDLWSLSVILYRALTGKKPFHGSMGEAIISICTKTIPPPSELAPDLEPAVDRFFERALARDPAARFQTVRELAAAFDLLAASSRRSAPPRASAEPPEPPEPGSSSSLSTIVTGTLEAPTSWRVPRPPAVESGEASAPDVTAPPFLASVPSPPLSAITTPQLQAERGADPSTAPFLRRRGIVWWAGGSAVLVALVAVVAVARGGRSPEAAAQAVQSAPGIEAPAPPAPASASPATSVEVERTPPAAASTESSAKPASTSAAAPSGKAAKGSSAAPTKKQPRRGGTDEPNFGY